MFFLACATPDSVDSAETEVDPNAVDVTTDVIVVGSGPAGVAAAWAAAESGADVILFERDDFAGFGLLLGGMALAVNTQWQEEAHIEDSVELAQSEWPSITGESGTHPGVTQFLEQSSETMDWLVGHGVTIEGLSYAQGEGSKPRLHVFVWSLEASPFQVLMEEFPGQVRLGMEVTEPLLVNGDLVGVRWRDRATEEEGATGAASVVLATGGFLRDLEAVAAARPDLAARDPLFETNLNSVGSTLPFLEQVGAGRTAPGEIGAYLHSIQDPRQPDGEALIVGLSGSYILVGADGRRFTNDSHLGSYAPVVDAPEGDLWLITAGFPAEAASFAAPAYNWPEGLTDPEALTAAEVVAFGSDEIFLADTLDDLAALTGLGTDLIDEIGEFDTLVAGRAEDPFGRTFHSTDALAEPPWLALRVHPGLAKNFGGVTTDLNGRVLDAEGSVIVGLYAAGEVAGMILGGGSGIGFSGSVGACYQGGRMAGTTAADEAAVR